MLDSIARLRRFNRIVAREIGASGSSYLGRATPLGMVSVLHLVRPEGIEMAGIRAKHDLDTGLLIRLLRDLEKEGQVKVHRHPADRRRRVAVLTPTGEAELGAHETLVVTRATQVLHCA